MAQVRSAAAAMMTALESVVGVEPPLRVRAWDGSEAGAADAPEVVVHSARALRRLLWAPGELGLGRAYVAGELDADGDLFASLEALREVGALARSGPRKLGLADRTRLLRAAVDLRALAPPPPPPPEESRVARRGRRHSRARDAAAISHHYDVGNDFYRLVLGPSMVYSCAVWPDEDSTLEQAQEAKHDLVCRKLGLRPGLRLLDVGCGWGSLALHAAQRYGCSVVAITLSERQAALARDRVEAQGLEERVDVRVQDYRDVDDGPFDAISSIGMAEHVGREQLPGYSAHLFDRLRPGGRLLNHAIAEAGAGHDRPTDTFITRYVFPDGELTTLAAMTGVLEAAGFEILDVEALRRHYGLTLRAWSRNLEQNWAAAVAGAGEGRARVWRLYMAASALAFEAGTIGVNQILAQRPGGRPPPLRRTDWT